MQLVVMGMHRSGTSVVARALNLLGIYFGPEGSTIAANAENPKGFWERKDVRQLNDYILQSNGFDWYKVSGYSPTSLDKPTIKKFNEGARKLILNLDAHRPWFIKEPRICLTLPLWLKHLEMPVCVYVYRNSVEVAESLRNRNGFPIQFGLDLWERYTYDALQAIGNLPVIFVNFNRLLEHPEKEIVSLKRKLTEVGVQPLREVNSKELLAFVDQKYYRNRSTDLRYLRPNQLELHHHILEEKVSRSFLKKYELTATSDSSLPEVEKLHEFRAKLRSFQSADDVLERIGEIETSNTESEQKWLEKIRLLKHRIQVLKERIKAESNTHADALLKHELELARVLQQAESRRQELELLKLNFENQKQILVNQGDILAKLAASKIDGLEQANRNLESTKQALIESNDRATGRIKSMEDEHRRIQEQMTMLQGALHSEQSEKARFADDIVSLEERLLSAEAGNSQLREQLDAQETRERDQDAKLRSAMDEASTLAAKVSRVSVESRELWKKIEQKDAQILEYWNQIQDMRLSRRFLKLFGITKKLAELKPRIKKRIKEFRELRGLKRKQSAIFSHARKSFDHSLPAERPKVSIIIVNRDGVHHLRNLFKKWKRNTIYPNYEIIVFDNDSSDESVNFLESLPWKVRIIRNYANDSFSQANNKAAAEANGEYLLFLNNDVQPFYGWLNQLVKTYLKDKNRVGSVGAKLIYPMKLSESKSLKMQHSGIAFRIEQAFTRPYNLDNGREYFELDLNEATERSSVTAACILVEKEKFHQVGGFDEKYVYGYEDVDLGLKLLDRGYRNYLAPGAVLFHHEFGTQQSQPPAEVVERRKRNSDHLVNKWYRKILNSVWAEMLDNGTPHVFSERKLKVGLVVTEHGENAVAGDYFTAKELAEQLQTFGWETRYYAQKAQDWYHVHDDTDVLIVLLHGYDLSRIRTKNKALIKIAWVRNWFERFSASSWFSSYDLVLASSRIACDHILRTTGKHAICFPIATNEEVFSRKYDASPELQCDYCFTGSYWDDPREIIDMLEPAKLPEYKFHIYGKNWEGIEKLQPYVKGFVKYSRIPRIYANTKLIIDDANRVTKSWGAVNSRVFDALMAGVLVISNNELGSLDTFEGKLPFYRDKDQLTSLIRYYLENEEKRQEKVSELRAIVQARHTYKHRAHFFRDMMRSYYINSIVIKVPAPMKSDVRHWGDYHLALGLKKEFEKAFYRVRIDLLDQWESVDSRSYSNVIVLRGLSKYNPKKFQFNMMWNISHPDLVSMEEYQSYDHVFIASRKWTEHLRQEGVARVTELLQCTDADLFRPETESELVPTELLFVGNSRGVMRKIITDLIPTEYDLSIYGSKWHGKVDDQYIKGEHIENQDLYKYYGGAKVLLNDHWEDMREKGFVSNRLFDALACEAIVVSDEVEGMNELFNGSVITYSNQEDLRGKIDHALRNFDEIKEKQRGMHHYISEHHTFAQRVDEILSVLKRNTMRAFLRS